MHGRVFRSLLLAMSLPAPLAPALAAQSACPACGGKGALPCRQCEGPLPAGVFCGVAQGCTACRGAGRRSCPACDRPEVDARILGERKVETGAAWLRVRPGPCVLRASTPGGVTEQQAIELRPSEVHIAHLLYGKLQSVAGSFRYSMANVFLPTPAHVQLDLSDGAVRFLNEFPEPEGRQDQIAKQSMITSLAVGEDVEAVLRVAFPEPMRSIVFAQLSKAHPPAGLHVWYRTEGVAWQTLYETGEDPYQGLTQAKVGAGGSRWFELRAWIHVTQQPHSWSMSKFLTSYLDPSNGEEHCCFAIVASPDPARARAR